MLWTIPVNPQNQANLPRKSAVLNPSVDFPRKPGTKSNISYTKAYSRANYLLGFFCLRKKSKDCDHHVIRVVVVVQNLEG